MNILDGIKNFLQFVNDNWVVIITIIGLMIAVYKKIKNYLKLSNEEKIAIAKEQIKEIMLRLVTDAECNYLEWSKAGSVKRAQVIEEVFDKYPILSKVTNQEELIIWIDEVIDDALNTMRSVFAEQNADKSVIVE